MDFNPRSSGTANVQLPERGMPKVAPPSEVKKFTVDASRWGLPGLTARLKPSMHAKAADPTCLQNGATVEGRLSLIHPGWVQLENGTWIPTKQRGHNVLQEQDPNIKM
ncbi:hypothetical protein PTSG_13087 [Salpingoeca rosetta]|uniref:Uncharacterized protein n=1 Tax=Salpingoeca rosetta (strain ATCC 50818 / BSB-021) TaxID=946362 RepID=F2UQ32_SALR5|nr:uncharacterized protein PTSG_13087 [Salpingoeca rosetta]EGD79700.1 hypothetical protein PTSG_13087 [Salpingoeca rosetta]|eukprot:XP_004988650.1 hypothetical protein PTSG_13087 [Salpingoeca rosetta]